MTSAAPKPKIIAVSGNLSFGNGLVGSSSQLSMTISNAGATTLSVSSISLPPGYSTTFTTASIPVAGKVTAFIKFSPTAAQNYTGTATVNSSATSGTSSLPVSGTGVGQTINVAGPLNFGSVAVSSNAQKVMTISNTGTTNLTVSSISYPPGFSGSTSGGVLTPGTFTNVTVTFTPTIATNYSGTITVNSDALGGTNTIVASGTGTAAASATIVLSGNLSFGNVPVNTSVQSTLVISNAGNATLHVTNVTYPTGFSGGFAGVIAPGKTTNVTVTFLPTATTGYGGPATVTSDATSGVNTIALSGTGTAVGAAIVLSGNLSFGNVPVNSSVQSILVISNAGNATLHVTNVTYPAGFSGSFTGTIVPGKTTNVTVTFMPTAVTGYGGPATVTSDATGGANTIAVSGAGTAVSAAIVLSGNLSFGNVPVNTSVQSTLVISNAGNATLDVTNVTYPTGFSGSFTGAIAPGTATNVTVTFTPTAATGYGGPASVTSDATGGVNTIAVSGAGTAVGAAIVLSGNLSFGNVPVNTSAQSTLVISNAGNATLHVTNVTYPTGFSGSLTGPIAPGTATNVTVTFMPTAATSYGGPAVVTSDATGGANTIAVSGTGASGSVALGGNLNFGSVLVNSNATTTLVISNVGNATMHVTSITYPAGFSGVLSGFIVAGNSTNVTVTFSPTAATGYGGTVTVNSDALGGTNTISASGTGTAVSGTIALGGNLSFGNVPVNTSTQSMLVISNTGNGNLHVTGITYPSGFSGGFSGTIAPGQTTNVTVTFSPAAAIAYSGSATVKSDAGAGVNTIAVSGTGTGGHIILSGNLSFGGVRVNTSAQSTLVISNSGTGTLNVSSISYPSGFSGVFSGAIAPGTSANVPVTFSPTSAINYSGPVAVNSDALGGTNTIQASGTGTRARIALSGNLSFGSVAVGTNAQLTLVVSNGGNANLDVTNINYPPGFTGTFTGTIAPGTTTNVIVTFTPSDTTSYSGLVTVVSDASSGVNTNAISGTGIAAVIALSGDLNFGGVIVGSSGQLTLTITNTGGVSLNVSSIDYPPGFSGTFSGAIAPGATTNVTVTFSPLVATNYNGVITVNSDAFKGTSTANASGTGIAQTRIISLSGDLNYGAIFAGSSAHLTLTITNSGNSVLTFTNITLPAQYAANISAGTIAPGGITNVDVAFTPPDTNTYNGILTVDSDATSGTDAVNVTGSGTNTANPVIALGGGLNFGDVMVGSAANLNLTISNIGNATLTISNINCPPGFNSSFSGAIEPGTSTNATVTFSPVAPQPYSGAVTVVSDATSGANTVAVSGDAFHYAAANAAFNGLYYPSNNVTFSNSGYFSAKSTTKGTISAKMKLAGKQYSVSGTLSGTGSLSKQIVRKGLSTLTVTIQAGFDGGTVLKGTVTDGAFTADLLANRSVFNSKTNFAPQTGIYSITISATGPVVTNGTGTVTVMSSGAARVSAVLGDGTKMTEVTAVGQSGQLPFFGSLYGNKGSILGWLTFGNTVGDELNGQLDWFKPAAIDSNFPNGFSLTTPLTGAKH
jgi:hypothetical protein